MGNNAQKEIRKIMARKKGTKNKKSNAVNVKSVNQTGGITTDTHNSLKENCLRDKTDRELFAEAISTVNNTLDFLRKIFEANQANLLTVATNCELLNRRMSGMEGFISQRLGGQPQATEKAAPPVSNPPTAKAVPQQVVQNNGPAPANSGTADILNDI